MHLEEFLEVKGHSTSLALPFPQVVVPNHVLIQFVLGVEAEVLRKNRFKYFVLQ